MALFKKKTKQEKESCGCGCNAVHVDGGENAENTAARVKVLGSGCAKCNQLEAAVKEAMTELGLDSAVEHVTDFTQIAAYGVMTTPALVIDSKVVSAGKVLKKDEAVKILQKLL